MTKTKLCPFLITTKGGDGVQCELPLFHSGLHEINNSYHGLPLTIMWDSEYEAEVQPWLIQDAEGDYPLKQLKWDEDSKPMLRII